jgi:TfoX/Sxy family transcriptional regulator of competence genes
MPYDDQLAQRVRDVLRQRQDVAERKMFGGVAFLVNGNMCCGVNGERLVLRLGPEGAEEALGRPHTRPMDFTGKAIKSMIYVEADGVASDTELRSWVEWALDHARSLPPK